MSRALAGSTLALSIITVATLAAASRLPDVGHVFDTAQDQDWCRDAGQYGDRNEVFCEVRELTEAGQGRLAASTSNGGLTVTGSARRDVRVQARVVAYADTMDEARGLAREVRVTLQGGQLRADGPSERGWRNGRGWHVSYRAEVPSRYDLALDTSNGSVAVTGVRGTIDAESSNGSLRLTDLGGRVRARTSNGSVTVQVSGSRWEGDGLSVVTSNGSARLDLPQPFNAELIVGTTNGSLNLDFPVTVQGRIGRRLETTLGSGGATIEVRTSNGSVRVGRR